MLPGATVAARDALATYRAIVASHLTAHLTGTPYDQARVDIFEAAVTELNDTAPSVLTATGPNATNRRWLTFFEAYFSNDIEGTKFSVEEGKDIAVNVSSR